MRIWASPGDDVTMPCHLNPDSKLDIFGKRIQWSKVGGGKDVTVLVSMGFHNVGNGNYQDRVHLLKKNDLDASIIMNSIRPDDFGVYRCDIQSGMHDVVVEIEIRLKGTLKQLLNVSFTYPAATMCTMIGWIAVIVVSIADSVRTIIV